MAEIQQQQVLPAPHIEAASKVYLEDLAKGIGAARQVDLSKLYGPQFVAPESALTQQARALAPGLGAYQPYLQAAQAQVQQGPQAYQQYMSPYQQAVMDTTLREYDIQAQKGLPGLAAQAINAGAYGGGREGVQRAEYQSMSDRNRAALQAQLLQQGYGQAQQLAQQNYIKSIKFSSGTVQGFVGHTNCRTTNIRCRRNFTTTSYIRSSKTISSTTSLSTIKRCREIWSRNYTFNSWLSRKRNDIYNSISKPITKYIRCWINFSWYLQ
jgi:hypothetical protein